MWTKTPLGDLVNLGEMLVISIYERRSRDDDRLVYALEAQLKTDAYVVLAEFPDVARAERARDRLLGGLNVIAAGHLVEGGRYIRDALSERPEPDE